MNGYKIVLLKAILCFIGCRKVNGYAPEYVPLPWYQSYNNVKHNRHDNFNEANMENLMNALAGLLCLLHAQFGEDMGIACFEGISTVQNDQNQVSTESFDLYAPTFPDEEQYEFIWDVIKQTNQHPVIDYPF